MVPPPASEDMKGSTTGMAKAVATAASTALPPFWRMPAPTSAPSGCSATTMPRVARGVRFVAMSEERIMRPPWRRRMDSPAAQRLPSCSARACAWRRLLVVVLVPGGTLANHAHHGRVVHVEDPAQRIQPRLLGLGLHLRPVAPRERGHEGGIDGALVRLVEEDPDLFLGAADADLSPEAEVAVAGVVLDLGMLAQVLEDLLLELVLELPLLVPAGLPPIGGVGPGDVHLGRHGPAGRVLDHGLRRRARAREESRRHEPRRSKDTRHPCPLLVGHRRGI